MFLSPGTWSTAGQGDGGTKGNANHKSSLVIRPQFGIRERFKGFFLCEQLLLYSPAA
jgi:hypothetical protein